MRKNKMSRVEYLATLAFYVAFATPIHATFVPSVVSDGSDGDFRPLTSGALAPDSDGVFNFTDVEIPAGVSVSFDPTLFPSGVKIFATNNILFVGL